MRRFILASFGALICVAAAAIAAIAAPRASAQQAHLFSQGAPLLLRRDPPLPARHVALAAGDGHPPHPGRHPVVWRLRVSAGSRHLDFLWEHRAKVAHRRASHPPHLANWLCIHRYEGSWSEPAHRITAGCRWTCRSGRPYGEWLLRHKGTAEPLDAAGADLDGGARTARPRGSTRGRTRRGTAACSLTRGDTRPTDCEPPDGGSSSC